MRVLFTCIQGYGHLHPMLPLARALEGSGHEVAFSSSERFCPRIREAGFSAFPAGPDLAEVHEQALHRTEAATFGPDDPWRFGALLFAGVAGPAKAADLTEVVKDWNADLVVHDATDFAGPVAAARAGVRYVHHSFGALLPPDFWMLGGDLMAPTWKQSGLTPEPLGGMFRHLYLDICPPSFQAPHARHLDKAHSLRPVPFDTTVESTLPPWVDTLEGRPTVYVTLGTIDNHAPGVFETVLEGLRDEPINVVVTVGHTRDPAELGPQPDHVHVERYIPQSLLFPRCDAVVAHGGSGTTLSALAAGLPLLLLPQGANQFWNAERAVELGIGSRLLPEELDPAAVRREARTLLQEPSYRSRAQAIRHEIEQMPGPEVAVELIERLGRERKNRAPAGDTAHGAVAAREEAPTPTAGDTDRSVVAVKEEAPSPSVEAASAGNGRGDGKEIIHARGLTKVYRSPSADGGGFTAVDHLDLSVHQGEIFGLLGPNGAGKTTTVGMLTTRAIPTAGEAWVAGVDVVADPARAKEAIGVVPQTNTLDRALTVWENLYFHGLYFGLRSRAAATVADELLERFRLVGRRDAEVHTLSGGMAQRLMLARAIVHQPDVLFLDEPTAGLDPQSRLMLWELVDQLHGEGQTILLTTHYMEEADKFCDRVAIMDKGKILALDTPAALKRSAAQRSGSQADAAAWLEQRLAALAHAPAADPDHQLHRAEAERALRSFVGAAEKLGVALDEVPPEDVTLETVFINLTGRDLRE